MGCWKIRIGSPRGGISGEGGEGGQPRGGGDWCQALGGVYFFSIVSSSPCAAGFFWGRTLLRRPLDLSLL